MKAADVKLFPARLLPALFRFYLAWERLAEAGACDAYGGAEFARVEGEYLHAGCVDNPEVFIRSHCNAPPAMSAE